jgi:hypothetical protein
VLGVCVADKSKEANSLSPSSENSDVVVSVFFVAAMAASLNTLAKFTHSLLIIDANISHRIKN